MDSTTERLATLIEAAPLRALAGLSVTNEALRHWATIELAEYLALNRAGFAGGRWM